MLEMSPNPRPETPMLILFLPHYTASSIWQKVLLLFLNSSLKINFTLGRPRGMEWGGRREEGSGWGTHVYLWRIHFDIWQI